MTTDQPQHTPHKRPRFLVALGYEWQDVHCPACLSVSDGWNGDGSPRYNGGWIVMHNVSTNEDMAYLCRCGMGKWLLQNLKLRVAMLPREPFTHQWINGAPLGWVLWDRNTQPERPQVAKLAVSLALQDTMAPDVSKQIRRALRGDLSPKELAANLAAVARRHGLPEAPVPPTINDVLGSEALLRLYWP